jgi:hypothetical protein
MEKGFDMLSSDQIYELYGKSLKTGLEFFVGWRFNEDEILSLKKEEERKDVEMAYSFVIKYPIDRMI